MHAQASLLHTCGGELLRRGTPLPLVSIASYETVATTSGWPVEPWATYTVIGHHCYASPGPSRFGTNGTKTGFMGLDHEFLDRLLRIGFSRVGRRRTEIPQDSAGGR